MKNRVWSGWFVMLLTALMLLNSPPIFFTDNQAAAQQTQTAGEEINLPGRLGEVVAQIPTGQESGQINLKSEKGFAGIPGAPKINYAVAFLWAIWVGWIFTTVGAFGGIMARVGHLTIFGLGAYSVGFKSTNPEMNALLSDTIRASNQEPQQNNLFLALLKFEWVN